MEGRRLRVGGKRVPGEGCFRAENPRSPKGDKNRRKKTGASRPARINCGKIFAGRSSQGFAKGFSAALYDAINEAYSTIGEFVYPKCEFIDIYNEKCKVFQNRKEFYNDNDIYFPKRITLTPKYRNQDLLYPQGSDVFFSKRVLDAFADEKIVDYDIIKGGCFYCTVETTDEI